jgi:hypothetical protein
VEGCVGAGEGSGKGVEGDARRSGAALGNQVVEFAVVVETGEERHFGASRGVEDLRAGQEGFRQVGNR